MVKAFIPYITIFSSWKIIWIHHQPSHFRSQYCHNICGTDVHHIVKKLRILSPSCNNIVNTLWRYITYMLNHVWSQYDRNFPMLWPHTVNIYVNHIVEVDNMVNNIVKICWQYCDHISFTYMLTVLWKLIIWWTVLSQYVNNIFTIRWQYCEFFHNMVNNIVNILWQYCGLKCEGWWCITLKEQQVYFININWYCTNTIFIMCMHLFWCQNKRKI